jgi:hypothetical protein
MLNCSKLEQFHQALIAARARLMLEVTGVSSLPDVRYQTSRFVAYDPAAPPTGDPDLLFPNTTTLVDVILNRMQTDRLAVITSGAAAPAAPALAGPPTGRAALIGR